MPYRKFYLNEFVANVFHDKVDIFCKISTVDLTGTTQDKSTVEISQYFVAFAEYVNFNQITVYQLGHLTYIQPFETFFDPQTYCLLIVEFDGS